MSHRLQCGAAASWWGDRSDFQLQEVKDAGTHGGRDRAPHMAGFRDGPVLDVTVPFVPGLVDGGHWEVRSVHEPQPGTHDEQRVA